MFIDLEKSMIKYREKSFEECLEYKGVSMTYK